MCFCFLVRCFGKTGALAESTLRKDRNRAAKMGAHAAQRASNKTGFSAAAARGEAYTCL
jgi:hypothetical protein